MNRMLKVETWPSIQQIPYDVWESLAGRDVVTSYGWLKTVEETHTLHTETAYFLARLNGTAVGAAVSYFCATPSRDLNLNAIFFGRLRLWAQRLGFSFLPVLECYPYRAYGKHLFLADGLHADTRCRVVDGLLSAIEDEARRHQASPCFLHVMSPEKDLWQALKRRGYRSTLDYPLTYLDIEWSDFEGYKRHIRRRSRNMAGNIVKEMNRNRREGVTIDNLATLGDESDRLWELLNLNYQKYNTGTFPFRRNFFQSLQDNLGEDALISVARKDGRLTGVSVTLKRGAVAYTPLVGVDHALAGPDATYFILGMYHPVAYATAHGFKRIYFGNAKYQVKQRRGCKISNCHIFYKSFRPGVNMLVGMWFRIHRRWFRSKHSAYELHPYESIPADRPA